MFYNYVTSNIVKCWLPDQKCFRWIFIIILKFLPCSVSDTYQDFWLLFDNFTKLVLLGFGFTSSSTWIHHITNTTRNKKHFCSNKIIWRFEYTNHQITSRRRPFRVVSKIIFLTHLQTEDLGLCYTIIGVSHFSIVSSRFLKHVLEAHLRPCQTSMIDFLLIIGYG